MSGISLQDLLSFGGNNNAGAFTPIEQLGGINGSVPRILPEGSGDNDQFGLLNSLFGDGAKGFSNLAGGLGSLFDIYSGSKQLSLAKDQFNLARNTSNRNIANQATTINNSLEARKRNQLGNQGLSPADIEAQLASYLPSRQVNGSAI